MVQIFLHLDFGHRCAFRNIGWLLNNRQIYIHYPPMLRRPHDSKSVWDFLRLFSFSSPFCFYHLFVKNSSHSVFFLWTSLVTILCGIYTFNEKKWQQKAREMKWKIKEKLVNRNDIRSCRLLKWKNGKKKTKRF